MLRSFSTTECEEAREAASARLDGELSPFEDARLEAHLRGCGECRAFAASLAGAASLLRGADLARPAAPLFLPRRRRPALRLSAAAAAVVVAVAAASSFAVGQLVGSNAGGPSATVGRTLSVATKQRTQMFGMLRRNRPGRMAGSEVIPV
jgi:predicted anti-sigma-YlaC factor YlaD